MKRLYILLLIFAAVLYTAPAAASAAVFTDVSDQHSSAKEVRYLKDKGIIAEQSAGPFRINEPITRLEASAMIQRALKLSTSNRPAVDFTDVPASHPHYALIAAMADEGIFTGNEKKQFLPESHLKRGQMAAVLVRAFDVKAKTTYRFRDVPASYWALSDIQALTAERITTGFTDNTFKPNDTLTRGHFALFLARLLEPSFRETPVCYKADNEPVHVVNAAVTTLWKEPGTKRSVDSLVNAKTPDIPKWLESMDLRQKQWLVGKLETQALYGQQVKVLQTKGDWVQVAVINQKSPKHAQGYPGWVPKNHIAAVYPNYSNCDTAIVTAKTAALTADENGRQVFRTISFNTALPVTGEKGSRLLVQTPSDGVKYIEKKAVKRLKNGAKLPAPSAAQIVETAEQFNGLPYLWAGTSGFGFDCSGFTYSVYRQHGIELPRDASVQAVNGTAVAKKDLQPGDLVFFAYKKGKGAVHHVGMYIGSGKMIHAPNPKRTVEIIPIATEPYQSEYAGARRYLK